MFRHPRLALVLALVLFTAVVLVLVAGSTRITAVVLGGLYTVACLALAAWIALPRRRRDFFSPPVMVLAYLALGIGIRSIASLLQGETKLSGAVDWTDETFAALMIRLLALAFLGTLSFLLGDRWAARRFGGGSPVLPRSLPSDRGAATARWLGLALMATGAVALLGRTGIDAFLHPGQLAVRSLAGMFWTFPLLFAGIYGFCISIAQAWSQGRRARGLDLVMLILSAVFVFALTSSKAALFVPTAMLLVLHHYSVRPIHLKTVAITFFSFTLALPLFYAYRAFGYRGLAFGQEGYTLFPSGMELLLGRSYMADSFSAVLLYTPGVYPYQYGRPWLELFYFWIPRAWWAEKPLSQSLAFGSTYFSSTGQGGDSFMSVSWLGDAWLNFGLPGIVFVMFLLGFALRVLYEKLAGSRPSVGRLVIYAAAVYPIAIGAEQSLSIFATLMASYLAVAAFLVLMAKKVPA